MVDEDFVMGYVCGFNDGAQSGGGGGRFDNIPLLKKYSFVGTNYGVGVVDSNNEMFTVPYNFPNYSVYEPNKVIFCPYPNTEHRRIRIAVLKNNNVVGLLASNNYLVISTPYQYNGAAWHITGAISTEKIENAYFEVVKNISNGGNYITHNLVFCYDICKYSGSVLSKTNTYTQDIVSKSKIISMPGTMISSSQFITSNAPGCDDISNDDYRGFLSAWSDCTGIEEV